MINNEKESKNVESVKVSVSETLTIRDAKTKKIILVQKGKDERNCEH